MSAAITPASQVLGSVFDSYCNAPRSARRTELSRFAHESRAPELYAKGFAESKAAAAVDTSTFYKVQGALRPMFGKPGVREPDIGDHPDFAHIKGSDETEFCAVTTLFMDIEGSTRLGLLYGPQAVQKIKNAFIRCAIDVVTSFDGHVHRIMGDAVMAYFGGTSACPHASAIDALNCAAALRLFAEHVVAPRLRAMGVEHDFGVRIGLDHGPERDVLWSSYGYPKGDEVTATSFYVDVASKLQSSAGRNQIMVGESMRSFLDLPDGLVSVKTSIRGGRSVPEPFVTPNHAKLDGTLMDYRQYVFRGDEYLSVGAFSQGDRNALPLPAAATSGDWLPLKVDASIHDSHGGRGGASYPACSSPVAKGKWVRFVPRLGFQPRFPYRLLCRVTNHGVEALDKGGEDRGCHVKNYVIESARQHDTFEHWEYTAYRGLHYLTVEVVHRGGKSKAVLGVFVA